MSILINAGSVDDIRSSLKNAEQRLTVVELTEEIEAERIGLGRITVINMLNAAIKRKQIKLHHARRKKN